MKLGRGLIAQLEVVHALVLRETRTRFGAHRLGYVWALLEPALMIGTFYACFLLIGRGPTEGMDLFGLITTGMIPYLLFANTTQAVAESINGNKALLFYPHVQPLDLVIARSILEAATSIMVFVVLMGGNVLHQQRFEISSVLTMIFGLTLAAGLGASLGLVFCGLGQLSNTVDRARSPLMRPFFWVSGIFFTANSLPESVRDLLLYNPVLHATELVRDGWYPSYEARHADPLYAIAFILILAFIGLSLERAVRRRIEVM